MKKLLAVILTVALVLLVVGSYRNSMDYIIGSKPSVTGIVQKVQKTYVLMYVEATDGYPNGSYWAVPLNVENKDSYLDIVEGDEIVVYYDGMVMETDPLQMGTVYAITLKEPAEYAGKSNSEENRKEGNIINKCIDLLDYVSCFCGVGRF